MSDRIKTIRPDEIRILKGITYLYDRGGGETRYYLGIHNEQGFSCRLSRYYKTEMSAKIGFIKGEYADKVLTRTYENGLTLYFRID